MRRIGIDLRVLQIGHQFRGIGEHVKHLIANFPSSDIFDDVEFVFYVYSDLNDPTAFVKRALKNYPKFSVERVGPSPRPLANTVSNYLSRLKYDYGHVNEERLSEAEVDSMLFVDFQLGVPAQASYQKALVMYDVIPYIFADQYHPSFRKSKRQGASTRSAGTDAYRQWQYSRSLLRATSHADKLLAISAHTKSDLVRELDIPAEKVETITLGVDPAEPSRPGAVRVPGSNAAGDEVTFDPDAEKFVFYLGGSDFRRRIPHLFEAYESVRAKQTHLKLVLAGADFDSLASVSETSFRFALSTSLYADDIYFVGYIEPAQRTALYRRALAFVYPTLYEGFGLPILEAMSYGCPVITYANSSTTEVGGDAALYAEDVVSMSNLVDDLANSSKLVADCRAKGLNHVQKFSWPETAHRTLASLLEGSGQPSSL